ncbi:MAG: methylmalonyl-CoA mutase [Chloroflexota bacterium]|nr:MAG: methylmalonyl-CoA mutase [Chloroflexota bacterium]
MDSLPEIAGKQKEWEETAVSPSLETSPEREIVSDLPKQRLYTPLDVENLDYVKDLGFPGGYPYTRGTHPTMFRSRLWGMAQYSGFGTPEDTNNRFKVLLKAGQAGVSIACDLPTQLGYDSDDPIAGSDVGVMGVACPSLREVETMFDGIPMDRVRILGSTSHPHIVLWSMYMAAAEKQGVSPHQLSGNVVSDCLQEYLGRGAYIFPPRGAMRLSLDFIEYGVKNIPKLSYQIANGYVYRESGATLVQEGAISLAVAFTFIEAALRRGLSIDDFAPRLSLNSAVHMNLFEEVAKFRALRRLWARILKERFGAKKPSSMKLSVGPGTGGSTFTAQQPENNITRATVEALAAILGGATYLHVAGFDEGHAIPSERAATIALRTQLILAYESGITDVVDPLGGSYYIEALTDRVEREISDYLAKIEARGGMIRAIESGWMQNELARSAYQKQKEIEDEKRIVVGVNRFGSNEKVSFELHKADPKVLCEMKRRLEELRETRDNDAVQRSLGELGKAAQGDDSLVPHVLEAVKNYATMGEIRGTLKGVLGEYRMPS